MIKIKNETEIRQMEKAGKIVAMVFEAVAPMIKSGVSTLQLDQMVNKTIVNAGGKPSFLGYGAEFGSSPFPASACISLNEEVVHGIPKASRLLQDGDIVSIDVGAYIDGFHGDACRTFCCGKVAPDIEQLVKVTEECFWHAYALARPGNRVGDLSAAIQKHAESFGYGIVRELTGHGIGRDLHEDPEIRNYGIAGRGVRLEPGMVLAIEPMVTLGSRHVLQLNDGWTIVTVDGKAASHYENTIAITAGEPLVLTKL